MDSIGNSLNTDLILNRMQTKPKTAEAEGNTVGLVNNFGHMLQDQIEKINQLQVNADKAVQTYAVGGPIELHDVVGAADKAELSLQLALQVRNKMVSAYQEISRMTV